MYADIAIIQGIVEVCVWNIGVIGSIRGVRGIGVIGSIRGVRGIGNRVIIHAFGKSVNIRPRVKAPVAVTIRKLFQLWGICVYLPM